MKAIILAAGRGSRMLGLTDQGPKCLVEIGGKTLLERQLDALRGAGLKLDQIGIVTGYRRERLTGYGLTEFVNRRWRHTNMLHSLAAARAWLETDTCIVSYSDIFYDASAVRSLLASTAPLAIAYDPAWRALWEQRFGDPLLDAETFRLHGDGSVAEIGGKPETVAQIEGQYMGLLRIAPAGWRALAAVRAAVAQPERDRLHMTGTLQRLIEAGTCPVQALPYHGIWGEADSPTDVEFYRKQFL